MANDNNGGIMEWIEAAVIFYIVMWILSFVFFLVWTPIKLIIWYIGYGRYECSHSSEDRPYAFTLRRVILTPYIDKLAGGAAAISITVTIFLANLGCPKSYVWTDAGTAFVCTAPAFAGLIFFLPAFVGELRMLFNYNGWVAANRSAIDAGTW